MRIRSLETIRVPLQPNVLFVRLHTDEGLVGLGEAFFGAQAVEAYLHETAAPLLWEMAEAGPEPAQLRLRSYVGFQGAGVETRGNSAVDLAMWDLLGKAVGRPLVDLLGGKVVDDIPVYNTCAGPGYIRVHSRQNSDNWGLDPASDGAFEDLHAFLTRPGELAVELLESGYTAMKVWPFDRAAEARRGTDISAAELRAGIEIVEAIRSATSDRMRVLVELHGLWQGGAAAKIARALGDTGLYWIEDPVRPDSLAGLARVREATPIWIASGETLTGRREFLRLLERGLIDVATLDITWCGGLTEARKIASLADAFAVPIAPHDCTGPVALSACSALVQSQPNGLIQETTRSFLNTWYAQLAEGFPVVRDGRLVTSSTPGHGVSLREDLLMMDGVSVRVSSREDAR